MMLRRYWLGWGMVFGLSGWLTTTGAIAEPQCSENINEILPQMLEDIPSYGNRVIQQARKLDRQVDTYSYVLIASKAEFEPLSLKTQQYEPIVADTTEQAFFTTLEKQYIDEQLVTFEKYYWIFLTPTERGWQLVHLLYRLRQSDPDYPITPPRDNTRGIVGRAAEIWLRDYNAHCFTD